MGEEFGAPALGFRPVFSRLITTVGAGPEGAAERSPPPVSLPLRLGQIAALSLAKRASASWGAARRHLVPDV